ncbi:hypothetical protein [Micromonospora sagamiensis]|uniref:hypothetical protein n=1 Tax=Micromonospora sagamiensis TaxID=47875 RepID=UPI001E3EE7E6|nr:hypothetical protein [Micromonospora sagamiensis]
MGEGGPPGLDAVVAGVPVVAGAPVGAAAGTAGAGAAAGVDAAAGADAAEDPLAAGPGPLAGAPAGGGSTVDVDSGPAASAGAVDTVAAAAPDAATGTSGMNTAYPRVPGGSSTGIAHAGWPSGHGMAPGASSPAGMASRYGGMVPPPEA